LFCSPFPTITPPEAPSFAGNFLYIFDGTDLILMIGSFGVSVALFYGTMKSPLAQPRNLVSGHFLSALVGVAAFKALQGQPALAAAAAVGTAIAVMLATKTFHPPWDAAVLIAVLGGEKAPALGYLYAVTPDDAYYGWRETIYLTTYALKTYSHRFHVNFTDSSEPSGS
jgi:CBS-domain-containing membrane protein